MTEQVELDYDKLFKPVVYAQIVCGCHPDRKRDKLWALHFLFLHSAFTFIFYLFVYNIICNIKTEDYPQMCRNVCLSSVYVVITYLYINMIYYQDKYKFLQDTIKAEYAAANTLPEEERTVFTKYGLQGRWLSRAWAILVFGGMLQFLLKSIFTTIISAFTGPFKVAPYYEFILPEAFNDDNPFVFIFLFVCTFIFSIYLTLVYLSVLPLGPIFLLYSCAKLEIVRMKIENVFNYEDDIVKDKVKLTVEELQQVYSYTEDINECCQMLYEILLKGTALVLPVTLFAVLQALRSGQFIPEFLCFILGAIVVGIIPCYYSNMLMEKSEEVRTELYFCGWEKRYDRSIRKSILLLLCRTIRPVAVRTIFRTVSLTTLSEVFQQAYGLFNLLNAMWT